LASSSRLTNATTKTTELALSSIQDKQNWHFQVYKEIKKALMSL